MYDFGFFGAFGRNGESSTLARSSDPDERRVSKVSACKELHDMKKVSLELTSETVSPTAPRMWAVSFTSLLFILLQSACTVAVAFSGVNAAAGLGSFAAAVGLTRLTGSFHADLIRIPMMFLALTGSIFILYIAHRARVLRARPASQWRIRPLTSKEKRKETFQFAISVFTILLIVAEIVTHVVIHDAF
jgi:hypothetical protein